MSNRLSKNYLEKIEETKEKLNNNRTSSIKEFFNVETPTVELSTETKHRLLQENLYLGNELSESQEKISIVLDKMKDILLYKNRKYGDSALHPNNVFFKGDSTNSILIRLDDKIGRIRNNTEEKPRINDVADIIGYCTLLLVSMGATEEDLEKLKD